MVMPSNKPAKADNEDIAYDKGGAAFTDEAKRGANPYSENEPDARGAWFNGWDDAADAAAGDEDEDEDEDDEDEGEDDQDEDEDEDEDE